MSHAYANHARTRTIASSAALFGVLACSAGEQQPASSDQEGAPSPRVLAAGSGAALDVFDPAEFAEPSLEFAPGIRWLWPGDAVEDATLRAEVERIAAAGYGMIEIQPASMLLDSETSGRIRKAGEASYLEHVRVVARAARAHGLRYELTLGSGWPNGGLGVPEDAQEQQLLWQRMDVSGPALLDLPLPAAAEPSWVKETNALLPNMRFIGPFDVNARLEAVVAAPISASEGGPLLGNPIDLGARVSNGRLLWDAPAGEHAVFAFYRNRTSHYVVIGAYPGAPEDARVVDHLGPAGAHWVIERQLAPWLTTLGPDKPDGFFVDSFELVGDLPWSSALDARYRARTGRAPAADLPFMFRANSETKYVDIVRERLEPAFPARDPVAAERVREDYERVRADAFRQDFIQPLGAAAAARGTPLRVQAHGGWGHVVDDYAAGTVPETESLYAGGSYDFVTLAASAAHVAGERLVSAEAFVTINLFTEPFDLDSCWAFAGHMYSAGINRLVHSSKAYPYTRADGSRWFPHDSNPDAPGGFTTPLEPGSSEWSFLPAFNRAQARIGYALSRGSARADVAWLMSAREHRDHAQLAVGPFAAIAEEGSTSATLRAASFTYDRISPNQLARSRVEAAELRVGAASYRAVIVDDGDAIDPEVLEKLQAAASASVPVIWAGGAPARARGTVDAAARDARVAALWSSARARFERLADFAQVPDALRRRGVAPALDAPSLWTLGIAHRETSNGRVVWVWNPSAVPQVVLATVHTPASSASWLDPETGQSTPLPLERNGSDPTVTLALPAARGGILFLGR